MGWRACVGAGRRAGAVVAECTAVGERARRPPGRGRWSMTYAQVAAGGGAEPVQAVQGWVQRERDQGGGVTRDEVELLRFGLRLVQEQADKYAEEGRQRHMQALEKVAA